MSREGNSPTATRIKMTPQSSDPVNPAAGHEQYADGTVRTAGKWAYDGAAWQPVGANAGFLATDWTSFAATYVGFGTITNEVSKFRRVGNNMEIWSSFTTGTVTAVSATLTIPDSKVLDTALLSASTRNILGESRRINAGGSVDGNGQVAMTFYDGSDTAKLFFAEINASDTALTKATGNGYVTSGESLVVRASIPISGWAANGLGNTPPGYRSVVTTDTATAADFNNFMVLSGATFTQTLPTAVGNSGKQLRIKHGGTSLTQVYTIDGNASETIDGTTTYLLYTNGETITIISDGAGWQVLDHKCNTGWTSYTPTGAWSTNTTYTGNWRRIGDSIQVRNYIVLTGTPTTASLTINLPANMTIDTAKLQATDFTQVLGYLTCDDSSSAAALHGNPGNVVYSSTTAVQMESLDDGGAAVTQNQEVTQAWPMTWATGDSLTAFYEVPISGWNP